ncbi:hypothetical protein Tco_1079666 [Tanacetum coccineum]|uniref:Uncharacterized protein n=1 Tax=Tanacetum coccineum TaxID=301880 RepID=A0ABQ5HTM7_9ASTR
MGRLYNQKKPNRLLDPKTTCVLRSERPSLSKSNGLPPKLMSITEFGQNSHYNYLPKERESAVSKKPQHHDFTPAHLGTLNLSAGLAPLRQMSSDHNSSELKIHDHSNELSSSKLVPKVVPPADKTATSRQELELLISPSKTC